MCGDGANDCGALKAAHVGISLSEAEASVASPFTSKEANISCVPRVIREGRAALVTSFGVFKFMVLYSIVEFFSTMILYSIDSNITDFEFLFIDLCLVVNFAFFFGKNEAYPGPLVSLVPLTSLLSLIPIMSLLLQIIIMLSIQLTSFYFVHKFSWFEPFQFTNDITYSSYENYAVFTVSQFQYITMAIVFSQGAPYRTSLVSNRMFFISLVIMTAVSCYIILFPANWIIALLELKFPPKLDFPLIVLGLGLINFVVCLIAEKFLIQYLMFKKLRYYNHDVTKSRRKYLAIDKSLNSDSNWPPVLLEFSSSAPSYINGTTSTNLAFEMENKMITKL